jgi:hypothetical protein
MPSEPQAPDTVATIADFSLSDSAIAEAIT